MKKDVGGIGTVVPVPPTFLILESSKLAEY